MNIHIITRVAKRLNISRQAVNIYATGRAPWPKKHLKVARDELAKWKAEVAAFNLGLPDLG